MQLREFGLTQIGEVLVKIAVVQYFEGALGVRGGVGRRLVELIVAVFAIEFGASGRVYKY